MVSVILSRIDADEDELVQVFLLASQGFREAHSDRKYDFVGKYSRRTRLRLSERLPNTLHEI